MTYRDLDIKNNYYFSFQVYNDASEIIGQGCLLYKDILFIEDREDGSLVINMTPLFRGKNEQYSKLKFKDSQKLIDPLLKKMIANRCPSYDSSKWHDYDWKVDSLGEPVSVKF